MKMTIAIMAVIAICTLNACSAENYKTYDSNFPQTLKPLVYPDQLEQRAFPFFEQALIIPDRITLDESTGPRTFDIVRADKLEHYRLIAELEMDGRFDLTGYHSSNYGRRHRHNYYARESKPNSTGDIPVDPLLQYKRDMWLRGLKLAYLDYKMEDHRDEPAFIFSAFNVEFQTMGDFMTAKLKLYKPRKSVAREILGEAKKANDKLDGLKREVTTARTEVVTKIVYIEREEKKQTKLLNEVKGEIASIRAELADFQYQLSDVKKEMKK